MDTQHNEGGQCPLDAACSKLAELEVLDSADQAAAALAAVQQACGAVIAAVAAAAPGQVAQMQAVLLSLSRMSTVLQALDTCLARLEVLPVFEDAFWSSAVLPLVDVLLYSERWQAVTQQLLSQRDLGRQLQEAAKCLVRDAIIPILCSVAGKCPLADTLALAGTYSAVLQLGTSAATLTGYRSSTELEGRTTQTPYVALNMTWHGIAKLWIASPQAVRRQLQEQGMGINHLLKTLCAYLKQDLEPFAGQAEKRRNAAKRMQFWLMLANKLAVACPEACSTGWEVLLKWHVFARQRLNSMDGSLDAADRAAFELAATGLFSKAAKFLVIMLNCTKSDEVLKVSVDRLRARMTAGHEAGDRHQPVHTLLAAVDILQWAPIMKSRVRQLCVQLVSDVVDTLIMPACAAVLGEPNVPLAVAEGLLVFMAASANASGCSEEDWDVWLRAQRQLFLLALHPHPLVTDILVRCWGDLIRLADMATAQQHVAALHQMLQAAIVAQMGNCDPPALVVQLASLLSCLLSSAPGAVVETFISTSLQVSPAVLRDASQLACLSVDLLVATLTDAAAASCTCGPAVHAALQQLSVVLHEVVSCTDSIQRLAQQPALVPEVANFRCLLECIQRATGYLATNTIQMDGTTMDILAGDVAQACTALAPCTSAPPCWAPPALLALATLFELCGDQPAVADAQLDRLLPVLQACQKHQETAACTATLAAAFRLSAVVPTSLFHAILADADPVLQYTAMEAYVNFIRQCNGALVKAMLPAAMVDPESGVMTGEHHSILVQHLARRPNDVQQGTCGQLHSWAAVLHSIADGAPAQLAACAKAYTSQRASSQPLAAAAAEAEVGGSGTPDLLDAARHVLCDALQHLEEAAQASNGEFDASTAQVLHQCSLKLTSIATQGSGAVCM